MTSIFMWMSIPHPNSHSMKHFKQAGLDVRNLAKICCDGEVFLFLRLQLEVEL